MLSVYTNQQELLRSTNTTKVSRLESIDKELLDVRQFSITLKNSGSIDISSPVDLELHVYTPDGIYLTGNHDIPYNVDYNGADSYTYQHLAINTNSELDKLGINRGQYKLVYNLFNNVLGSYSGQKIWIKEISPSRRELRLQLTDNSSITLRDQLIQFKNRWDDLTTNNDVFDSFVLNFGFNETFQVVNMRFDILTDTPEIVVRLYAPLPSRFGEKAKLWISEEVINPVLENVSIVPKFIPDPVTYLAGPNFELEQFDGGSVATDFKNWNELLAANLPTSQQLIDSYFSGSLSGIKLNTSYRIFDNFVHYGSAVERVKNFKYKMELIEHYSDRIQEVSQINGGNITQNNLADLYIKRNRVVSGFDDFEKYLFFESTGSALYTHFNEASGSLTSSSIQPWPKTTPTPLQWQQAFMLWSTAATTWNIAAAPDPYGYFANQVRTTSATGLSYYNGLIDNATLYDRFNIHKLQNTIPIHIQNSDGGAEYSLFINMIGQHFDILWTYINGLTDIRSREEHPKDGMPDDLLYSVAESMGFNLLNGKSASDLWKYSLGVDSNGDALQTSVNGINSLSDGKHTKEIWRRIVNNLPYILKSKGTSRAIKALVSCFGIPSTVLTIKEYGGPSTFTDNDHFPEYVHDKYHYAWLSSGSLSLSGGQFQNGFKQWVDPNVLEFRFKTDNNYNYGVGYDYNLVSISSASVSDNVNVILNKETNDDNQGTITVFNTSTGMAISASNLEIFDNSWILVTIQNTGTTSSLNVVKSLYGKTIYNASSSYQGSLLPIFTANSTITIASGSRAVSSSISSSTHPTTASFNGTGFLNTNAGSNQWDSNFDVYYSGVSGSGETQVSSVYNAVSDSNSYSTIRFGFSTTPQITLSPSGSIQSYKLYVYNSANSQWYVKTAISAGSLQSGITVTLTGPTSTNFSTDLNTAGFAITSDPTGNANTIVYDTLTEIYVTLPNGQTVSQLSKFNGHFHEIRLWSGSLNDDSMEEHAASPATYTYNVNRSILSTGEEAGKPYDHLLQRFTLATKEVKSGSFYQSTSHPNQTLNTGSIYFIGYGSNSGSITFEGFEETYYTPSPSLGGNSLYTNKVRIESSSLDPNKRLNTKTRIEKSSFDRYSIDSNRVGVYFSPQTAINEDIFNQLGYFEIDDYIGDPADLLADNYNELNNFAINYWKKYENRNDFEAYFRALEIYDFTLFKYIKRLLPKRVNAIVGLVVEPNVLERSKVKLLNKPVIENLKKDVYIPAQTHVTASGEYQDLLGVIEPPVTIADSEINIIPPGVMSSSLTFTSEYTSLSSTVSNDLTDVNKLGTSWVQHRYISKYKITESGSYTPLQTTIYAQRPTASYATQSITSYSSSIVVETRFQTASIITLTPTQLSNAFTLTAPITGSAKITIAAIFNDDLTIYNDVPTPIYGLSYQGGPATASVTIPNPGTGFYLQNLGNYAGNVVISSITVTDTYTSSSYTVSSSIVPFYYEKYQGLGYQNARFYGSKLTSLGGVNSNVYPKLVPPNAPPNTIIFNSTTTDGGPVVKVTKVNPNQIVFANNQLTTVDRANTGRGGPVNRPRTNFNA